MAREDEVVGSSRRWTRTFFAEILGNEEPADGNARKEYEGSYWIQVVSPGGDSSVIRQPKRGL